LPNFLAVSHVPYEYDNPEPTVYIFVSEGKKRIDKVVEFVPMEAPNVMNLGFGDLLLDGSIDYMAISNNGDIVKVLKTVVEILKHFLAQHPKVTVYFTGSTLERTKLYSRILKTYYSLFSEGFLIYGILQKGNDWHRMVFDPAANSNYSAFLIKRIN